MSQWLFLWDEAIKIKTIVIYIYSHCFCWDGKKTESIPQKFDKNVHNLPHDDYWKPNKDEESTADANHGKCPEVDIPIIWKKTGIQCIPQSSLFRPGKYWGIGMDRFSLSITLCQHFLILTSYNQLAEARHFLRRFWTKPSVSNNFSETQNIYERKCSMFEYQYQYQKKNW